MMRFIPPRLRMPVRVLIIGSAATVFAVILYGWVAALYLGPFVLVGAAGWYVMGGRDSDLGAVTRYQLDERQVYRQLQMQALVGKVMTAAAVIAYFVALAVKATLWPFAIFIALPCLAGLAGWVIYREHGDARNDDVDVRHA